MTLDKENNRIVWIELLRIVCCFAVIALHQYANLFFVSEIGTSASFVSNIINFATRFCVPVFFMISGMFYLNPNADDSKINRNVKYNCAKFLIIYIIANILYNAYFTLVLDQCSAAESFFPRFLERICKGACNNHLWYIRSFIILLIVTPLIRRIVSSRKYCWYFCLLCFAFSTGFYTLKTSLECFGLNNTLYSYALDYLPHVFGDTFYTHSVLLYFVLGNAISYIPAMKNTKAESALLFASIIVVILLFSGINYYFIFSRNALCEFIYGYSFIGVFILSILVFLFFRDCVSKINFSNKTASAIRYISKKTFGIYIVHLVFNELFNRYWSLPTQGGSVANTLLRVLLIFALSYLLTWLFKLCAAAVSKLNVHTRQNSLNKTQ